MFKLWDSSKQQHVFLSHKLYEMSNNVLIHSLKQGDKIRLISGVQESKIPGYHPDPEYVTICPLGTSYPQYLGVPKDTISLVKRHTKESTPKQHWAQKRNFTLMRLKGLFYSGHSIKDCTTLCKKAQDEIKLALPHIRKALEIVETQPFADSFKAWAVKERIKIPK